MTRWDFREGEHTGFHRHAMPQSPNRPQAIVPLADGTVRVVAADGTVSIGRMKRGEPYHRPAMAEGDDHDVISTTAGPFAFLEIELKPKA